jgi:predicted dehydrogenase
MPGSIAQPVRWGILSTANISHQFARDFAHADGGALVAVASRSLEKAQAFAERHGIARAYGCYGELLADPELDAVYVSTPHTLHYSNCLAAIAAGKAVLCEKPMTVTPQESRALVAAAASANVYLMEAMWTWFLPAIRRALAWVEAGHIGRLRQVQADFGFPMPFDASSRVYARELGGGCLLDMGIYPIALAWLFLRRDPAGYHVVSEFAPNGADDEVAMRFDYGDCQAALATSFRRQLPNIARLVGEEGVIEIPDFWRARRCVRYAFDQRVEQFEDQRKGDGFEFEIAAVNRDLAAGLLQSETVTWADSIRFQEHMSEVMQRFPQH